MNDSFFSPRTFAEVDYFQVRKHGQAAAGDVFLSELSAGKKRIVTALSDGLGSGIKANVLASLTAKMFVKFILNNIQLQRAAEIIVNSLPVDSDNGLSYATFTLLDMDITRSHHVHIVEYANPPYLVVRNGETVTVKKEEVIFNRKDKTTGPETEALYYSRHLALPGDRIVFFSDGVTQAGLGGEAFPSGWGDRNARLLVLRTIRDYPSISARNLARRVVEEALQADHGKAHDDISCGVVYFRDPRDMLVVTGPPFHAEHDQKLADLFSEFVGTKIVSGGTTASIIAREQGGRQTAQNSEPRSSATSPNPVIKGADLVTEGILTLGECAELLEKKNFSQIENFKPDQESSPAEKITSFFLNCDRIAFVVGTKINEAHHDPTFPAELEIRRNIIKKIETLLKVRYMKDVSVRYL
jgi:hypothetical protein